MQFCECMKSHGFGHFKGRNNKVRVLYLNQDVKKKKSGRRKILLLSTAPPAAPLSPPRRQPAAVCCQFLWSLERDSLLHLQGSSMHFLFLPPTVQVRHAVLNFALCVQPSDKEVLIPRAASFFPLWLCLALSLSLFALSIELTFDCELLL